jgi:quercetin dioxygenase-like cupin family protein
MIEGQTVRPGPGERLTCLRSGEDGGDFVFEFEVAPGSRGPERHSHDEGDETIEVKSGTLEVEVNGEWTRLGPRQSVTLRPGDVHTFRNASRDEPVICIGTAGPRFERLIEITNVLEACYYMTYVDPGASRIHDRWLLALIRAIAAVARLGGVGRRMSNRSACLGLFVAMLAVSSGCEDEPPAWVGAMSGAGANWGYYVPPSGDDATARMFAPGLCGEVQVGRVVQNEDGSVTVGLGFRILNRRARVDGEFVLTARNRSGAELEVRCGEGSTGHFRPDHSTFTEVEIGSAPERAPRTRADCRLPDTRIGDIGELVISAPERATEDWSEEVRRGAYGHDCPNPSRRVVLLGAGGLVEP